MEAAILNEFDYRGFGGWSFVGFKNTVPLLGIGSLFAFVKLGPGNLPVPKPYERT